MHLELPKLFLKLPKFTLKKVVLPTGDAALTALLRTQQAAYHAAHQVVVDSMESQFHDHLNRNIIDYVNGYINERVNLNPAIKPTILL